MMLNSLLEQLCASTKLEREKAEKELFQFPNLQDHFSEIQIWILCVVEDSSASWENSYGALVASRVLCERMKTLDRTENELNEVITFEQRVRPHLLLLHDHSEFRVRIAAGEVMGALCSICPQWFVDYLTPVKDGIRRNLERHVDIDTPTSPIETVHLVRKLSPAEIFHDTAGWKSLETWLKCLQNLIRGLGTKFGDSGYCRQDPDILALIFSCLSHTNRFVRETGYHLVGTLVEEHGCYKDPENLLRVAKQLRQGLGDNWSQVRMASSVAARQLFQSLSTNPARVHTTECDNTVRLSQHLSPYVFADSSLVEPLYPTLLPAMCLNRYYIAEGVRLYSQESWRLVTGGFSPDSSGKMLVERYLEDTIAYYLEQSDADNHAVREAACACISELGSKLPSERLQPYLGRLLEGLIVCFEDDSWPVRDAACVAIGKLVVAFPEDTLKLYPDDGMWSRFKTNLCDSIASVRQGAAFAAASAVMAMKNDKILQDIITFLDENLLSVKSQPVESKKHSGVSTKPAVYSVAATHPRGVALPGTDGLPLDPEDGTVADMWHDERHSNQQMYSCGSLAPKMRKGRKGGGCHDGLFHKICEPWERSDGCLLLMTEMACYQEGQTPNSKPSPFRTQFLEQISTKFLPQLSEIFQCTHFPHHVYLLETLCKCIPRLCQAVGKMKFKAHLQNLLPGLCYSVKCDTSLTCVAAEEAFRSLALQIGPSILRGRVEMFDPNMLSLLQGIL